MESEAKTNMEQRATNPLEVISLSPSIHPFTYLLGLRRLGDGAARVVVILRSARGRCAWVVVVVVVGVEVAQAVHCSSGQKGQ